MRSRALRSVASRVRHIVEADTTWPKSPLVTSTRTSLSMVTIGDGHSHVDERLAAVMATTALLVGAIASNSASVRPTSSASSHSSRAPACDTTPWPPVVTTMPGHSRYASSRKCPPGSGCCGLFNQQFPSPRGLFPRLYEICQRQITERSGLRGQPLGSANCHHCGAYPKPQGLSSAPHLFGVLRCLIAWTHPLPALSDSSRRPQLIQHRNPVD